MEPYFKALSLYSDEWIIGNGAAITKHGAFIVKDGVLKPNLYPVKEDTICQGIEIDGVIYYNGDRIVTRLEYTLVFFEGKFQLHCSSDDSYRDPYEAIERWNQMEIPITVIGNTLDPEGIKWVKTHKTIDDPSICTNIGGISVYVDNYGRPEARWRVEIHDPKHGFNNFVGDFPTKEEAKENGIKHVQNLKNPNNNTTRNA